MSRAEIDSQLEQVAAALRTIPLHSEAAWESVRVRVQVTAYRQVARWPLALSMSLVAAMFVVANLGVFGPSGAPTLSAAYIPVPARSELTPTPVGWTMPALPSESTLAPPVRSRENPRAATPVPRPPDS